MNLKLLLANRGLSTVISNADTGNEARFTPNNLNFVGIGGYFWDFSVKLYLSLPLSWFLGQTRHNQSKILDLQASLYREKWFFEGAFQQYNNLYPEPMDAYGPIASEEEQAGLLTRRVIVNATYMFSGEQVSVKSPFSRNVVQTRNAGSWLLTTGFSSTETERENSLLPAQMGQRPNSDIMISEISAVGFEFRPGYAYNFSYKKFFTHASASAGAALQYKLYKSDGLRDTGWGVAPVYNFRAALGYDNGNFFGGVSAIMNHTQLGQNNLQIRQSSRNIQLFIGYRFAEPRWLQKLEPSFLSR